MTFIAFCRVTTNYTSLESPSANDLLHFDILPIYFHFLCPRFPSPSFSGWQLPFFNRLAASLFVTFPFSAHCSSFCGALQLQLQFLHCRFDTQTICCQFDFLVICFSFLSLLPLNCIWVFLLTLSLTSLPFSLVCLCLYLWLGFFCTLLFCAHKANCFQIAKIWAKRNKENRLSVCFVTSTARSCHLLADCFFLFLFCT